MMIKSTYFALRRLFREPIGPLVLMGIPVFLLFVFGSVDVSRMTGGESLDIEVTSISFVLAFQMFGGSYLLTLLKEDFFGERKWRIYALPISRAHYAIGLLIASTLFSFVQGLILMGFSMIVYDVTWGQPFISIGVIFLVCFLSQIVSLLIVISTKSYFVAERVHEVYGFGFMILSGLFIGLPQWEGFEMINTYLNPIELSQNIILSTGDFSAEPKLSALSSFAILLAAIILSSLVAAKLGRRRLS